MKIESKYQEGLKKLLKEKPLDEINVVMLCDAIKSNRQTFYYHFRDISDVVESILLKEKIGYGKKLFDIDSVNKTVVAYINNNYSFLSAIHNSFASDTIDSFFYSIYYQRITSLLKENKKITTSVIRYLCNLYSKELVYWIASKRKEKQVHLLHRFMVLWNYFTNQYLLDIKKENSR